jgi:AFG3 family protein
MINLLGKRPFDRPDDMDKWLDKNMKQERSAPPPLENVDDGSAPSPAPAPVATFKAINWENFRLW